ncbi:hypothetical protein Tco_1226549 [Tanacetum coccineum]
MMVRGGVGPVEFHLVVMFLMQTVLFRSMEFELDCSSYSEFLIGSDTTSDILKKFDFWSIKTATTPIESNKPLVKDKDGEDVDVHVYRSMIGSLMYLTISRPDIMFAKIDILAMQEKKQDFMKILTEVDMLQLLTVVGKTKHIEIRFHFIRDCYEKRLIEVIKIHTDSNVADLLTKGFDVTRFNFLVKLSLKGGSAGYHVPSVLVVNHITNGHQFTMSNRHQELTSPKQTTLSKANGLGKDFPNPFIAGSLPKTIKQSNDPPLLRGYTLGSGEDNLELKELMENSMVKNLDSPHKFLLYLRITSSPSLSLQPTQPSPSPERIQPIHEAEDTASMPHDSPLHVVHSHGSTDGSVQQHDLTVLVTKLNDRIDGLEKDLQQTKKTYSTALTKLVLRRILPNRGGRFLKLMKIQRFLKYKEEDVHGEATSNTASPPKVSTAIPHVYTRRSAKDKVKAIMEEPATLKKVKKRTQVQLIMDEELARKIEEEERIRFNAEQEARALQEEEEERLNLEAARELLRQLDQRHEVLTQPTQISELNGMIQAVGIRRKTLARRRASDNQGQDSSKRQKKEKETANYEEEKDELRMWLTVVPDEEEFVDPEILHTKFPIVDWESQSLGNMHVYKIIRADGNTSYHKTFESMLKSFDRHDLEVLHRLVMERFQDNTPEGYNLMLWGDLKILVDPEQDDDIWKNQNQWKIISWKLYETCGVHTLMVDGTLMTIHMFVEKKYPLTKETLQKMLNWKLDPFSI